MAAAKSSKMKENMQGFLVDATSVLAGMKKMVGDEIGKLTKDLKVRQMWNEDRGKKMVEDFEKETEKFFNRLSKDSRLMAAKLMKSSPILTGEACKKMFATKEELQRMCQKLVREEPKKVQ